MAHIHDTEEARKLRVEASKTLAQKRHAQELKGKVFDQDEHGAGVMTEPEWRKRKDVEPEGEDYA